MALDCKNLTEVTDITNQCKYEDSRSGDKRDFVSCCQDNGYNELRNKLKTFKNIFPSLSDSIILKSMCECCNKIPHYKRTHEKFDECVERTLYIEELKGKKL